MKTAPRILAAVVFAIVRIASVTRADNADLKDLLSGNKVPLTLKLKDLDASWRRVHVSAPPDMGESAAMYAQLLGGPESGVYYTKGEVVTLAGLTYIIAYRPPIKTMNTLALIRGGTPALPEALTPETPLALALIQLRTAGSLTDIRSFNLDEETAERTGLEKAVEGAQDKAVNVRSISNLRQIGLGLFMYADDNDNKLPDLSDAESLKKALAGHIKDEKVFVHPRTSKPYQPNSSLSHKEHKGPNASTDMVMVYEAEPAEDGTRALLFGDGHVERANETRWLELKKASNIP